MKFLRYGPAGREKPGMLDGDGRATGGMGRNGPARVAVLKAAGGASWICS